MGWNTNENSYFPFIENFLSTLYMYYKELDKQFAVVQGKHITVKAGLGGMVKDGQIRKIGSSRSTRFSF